MPRLLVLPLMLAILFTAVAKAAEEKRADDLAAIAPLVDDQTVAVVRIDLPKIDLAPLQIQLLDPLAQRRGPHFNFGACR